MGVPLAVPVGDPDVVRFWISTAVPAHEVSDRRAGAAVDPRDVAVVVQSESPAREKRQHRGSIATSCRVALHVVEDRIAREDAQPFGVGYGGACRRFALMLRLSGVRAHRGTAAFIARCLRPDPDGYRVPPRDDLVADPALGEVGLGAGGVDAIAGDVAVEVQAARRGTRGAPANVQRRDKNRVRASYGVRRAALLTAGGT